MSKASSLGRAARGAKIGFPTANLDGVSTLVPGDGVYAGSVTLDDQRRAAAINIGPNPTFGEQGHKIEVHILDFDADLYGRELDVDLFERLRDTVKFDSVSQLKDQLVTDVEKAKAAFARAAALTD